MTLLLAAANSEQIVMLADRRLTSAGMVKDEDAGKLCSYVLGGARFAVAFTGLARVGGFDMRRWMLDALWDSAEPSLTKSFPTLQRFADRASRDFAELKDLRPLAPADKRTEFMFVGYSYDPTVGYPALITALVSNFRNTMRGTSTRTSWPAFALNAGREPLPRRTEPGGVVWGGAAAAVAPRDVTGLQELVTQRKPYQAITNKAIETMIAVAAKPQAGGTIGSRLVWVRVPADINEGIETGYYAAQPTFDEYMPDLVVRTPGGSSAAAYFRMGVVDRNQPPPQAIPRVHRHAPCPCKSERRYKDCHGKRRKYRLRGTQ